MISKRVAKSPSIPSKFGRLAEYIASAKQAGEKLEDLWMVNCDAGEGIEDLDLAIKEIEAVQSLNDRAGEDRTYHLIVSFAGGEKPPIEDLRAMEMEFAKALGFEAHQRVCASHTDTRNFHFHVAYNRIDRETFRAHKPWNDFKARDAVCRRLEREYGLQILTPAERGDGLTRDAREFEALTWEQSFQRFVLSHKDVLLEKVGSARGWEAVHASFEEINVALKPRGNGFTIENIAEDGNGERIKASSVDRSLSRAALEKRFGPYVGVSGPTTLKRRDGYARKLLTRHPFQESLFRAYRRQRLPRPSRRGLVAKHALSWRAFLYMQAELDSAACLIIFTMLETTDALVDLFLAKDRAATPIDPALGALIAAKTWATSEDVGGFFSDGPASRTGLHGAKINRAGDLIIPFRDMRGTVRGLMVCSRDGETRAIGNVHAAGSYHVIGGNRLKPENGTPPPAVMVVHDLNLGRRLYQATHTPVVVEADRDQTAAAVSAFREAHPDKAVVSVGLGFYSDVVLDDPEAEEGEQLSFTKLRAAVAEAIGDHAFAKWSRMETYATPDNAPELKEAGVRGFGVKVDLDHQDLVIPLYNQHHRLVDVLTRSGSEATRENGDLEGAFHYLDSRRDPDPETILVCAGYANAAALHQATQKPVAMAPDEDALAAVCDELRRGHRAARIIVCGENLSECGDHVTRVERPANRFADMCRETNGFAAIRRDMAAFTGDTVIQTWDMSDPARRYGDTAWRRMPDDKGGGWAIPYYDERSRLAAARIVDADQVILDQVKEEGAVGLHHWMGGPPPRGSKQPVLVVTDAKTALELRETIRTPILLCPDLTSAREAMARIDQNQNGKAQFIVLAEDGWRDPAVPSKRDAPLRVSIANRDAVVETVGKAAKRPRKKTDLDMDR